MGSIILLIYLRLLSLKKSDILGILIMQKSQLASCQLTNEIVVLSFNVFVIDAMFHLR